MSELLDSDYFIDKNGDKRYATGNSLGIQPGAAAEKPQHLMEHTITHESSPKMLQLREDSRLAAFKDELAEQPDCRSDYDGLRIIANATFVLASDPDAGRAQTEAAKFYLRAGGYMQDQRSSTPPIAIQVNIGSPIMEQLSRLSSEDAVMLDETDDE